MHLYSLWFHRLFFFPCCPLFHLHFIQWTHLHSFSLFFWPETLYNLITDTSLQFQIPTLCQIPISCCLISIHLLLFLLLLPFPAWTSSSPASSNFLRKAPHRVLLESEPPLHASDWPLFILANDSCQRDCFFPFLCFTPWVCILRPKRTFHHIWWPSRSSFIITWVESEVASFHPFSERKNKIK